MDSTASDKMLWSKTIIVKFVLLSLDLLLFFERTVSLKAKKITGEDEIGRIINRDFTDDFVEGFVLIGEEEFCLPQYYLDYAETIKNLEMRDSDIIVASFPKAGTTWEQEMVWLIEKDQDFKGAEISHHQRFPFLELCGLGNFKKQEKTEEKSPMWVSESIEFVKQMANPRFIKTHLPFSLLPRQILDGSKLLKIIYVMRNPKDVFISYYHHGNLLEGWRADLEDFSKVFLADKILYGPFWKHMLGFWEHRNNTNVLILRYEDMKKDLSSAILQVAEFLGKQVTPEQVQSLSAHLSFESMKKNKAVNFQDMVDMRKQENPELKGDFFRSGTVGKYKQEMSAEMVSRFNDWIRKGCKPTCSSLPADPISHAPSSNERPLLQTRRLQLSTISNSKLSHSMQPTDQICRHLLPLLTLPTSWNVPS